jgi:hypothetical protein
MCLVLFCERIVLYPTGTSARGTLWAAFSRWKNEASRQRRLRLLVLRLLQRNGWSAVVRVFSLWKSKCRQLKRQRAWCHGFRLKRRLITLKHALAVWKTMRLKSTLKTAVNQNVSIFLAQRSRTLLFACFQVRCEGGIRHA